MHFKRMGLVAQFGNNQMPRKKYGMMLIPSPDGLFNSVILNEATTIK